jgi:2-oxo-3-hexenedioate decarboxylase
MLEPGSHAFRLLEAYDRGESVAAETMADIIDTTQAAEIVGRIAAARVARGEQRLGYKIGFTNRTIWPLYGVDHPIWAPVYDTTVTDAAAADHVVSLAGFCEPRLEPEIVLGLAAPPQSAAPRAVAAATAWVAHGFEVVQSVFPGWRFTGAQSCAAQGLHARLLIGPRIPVSCLTDDPASLPELLAGLHLTLREAGESGDRDRGVGANVLDGPCHAVVHLMQELAARGEALCAGDIITTGTITDAQPLQPGQRWQSSIEGVPGLAGLRLSVRA